MRRNIPKTFAIPQSFIDAHYCLDDLLRLLSLNEIEFWARYKSGYIPAAVWLPTTKPLAVWSRELIDAWIAEGCPAPIHVLDHEQKVLAALRAAVEAEHDLGEHVRAMVEEN